ncbi:MAG: PSD1 domain-containing protein [Planctomycetes bacterium]|nr:PSD1 domain-containing protein [Planctomycetota bacterium]
MSLVLLLAGTCGLLAQSAAVAKGPPVEYNRDIRPILSNNCFKCHGPDAKERQAGLRLDVREEALKPAESGRRAIVPGKLSSSNLVRRILSSRDPYRMPPPSSNKKLTAAQKELLQRWIEEGAEYQPHWSLIPPRRPALSKVADASWPRNGLDRFVLAGLESRGWKPSPEADRTTLIRRVTLDLTGLPPTPAEVNAFLADTCPDAYEHLVDRLLASPHHGERMALDWLDLARYADTHGFHLDSGRDMWRWRDWVIGAFNKNMPFDQFTIEQIAGDLLPGATLSQKVASGFNRNHMINFEGGAIPQEYHNAYVVDRVNTTTTVWLGATFACAQCHDHKYDPFTQKDYYRFYAFFYNLPENGLDGSKGNAAPFVKAPTLAQQQRLDTLAVAITQAEQRLKDPVVQKDAAEVKRVTEALAKLRQRRAEVDKQIPTTMVMQEMLQARETFLLLRGQYDKRGEKVTPAVPASLPPLPSGAPANRLGLAKWLVDRGNPLTARVAVNRFWQSFFGVGLVKTSEDFGSQGEPPSHPELLDWLAVEFVDSGWDVKHIVRLIMTSATYREASAVAPEVYARDPENRLLGRGGRIRLPAEYLRDQALAVSGLLEREVGGASVFPYQPPGLWRELTERGDSRNWSAQFYVQSHGRDLYRRGMYTFWKRTSPPPSLLTFDAPDRESCTVRRSRTNTPLQALVLMNDPTYVEASRKLAERLMKEAKTTDERIVLALRLTTARKPSAEELAVLRRVYEQQLAVYRKDHQAALKLLGVGESKRDEKLDAAELASWAVIANVVLNLDETVTTG